MVETRKWVYAWWQLFILGPLGPSYGISWSLSGHPVGSRRHQAPGTSNLGGPEVYVIILAQIAAADGLSAAGSGGRRLAGRDQALAPRGRHHFALLPDGALADVRWSPCVHAHAARAPTPRLGACGHAGQRDCVLVTLSVRQLALKP